MSDHATNLLDAGEQYHFAVDFALEDTAPQRLRYHLLRLTVVGLSRDEIDDLCELGRLACEEADVSGVAARIRERDGVTPLAAAIAGIMAQAQRGLRGRVSLRAVMLGTVLGAYTGLRDTGGIDAGAAAISGAVGGAVAASAGDAVAENIARIGAAEYCRAHD